MLELDEEELLKFLEVLEKLLDDGGGSGEEKRAATRGVSGRRKLPS